MPSTASQKRCHLSFNKVQELYMVLLFWTFGPDLQRLIYVQTPLQMSVIMYIQCSKVRKAESTSDIQDMLRCCSKDHLQGKDGTVILNREIHPVKMSATTPPGSQRPGSQHSHRPGSRFTDRHKTITRFYLMFSFTLSENHQDLTGGTAMFTVATKVN